MKKLGLFLIGVLLLSCFLILLPSVHSVVTWADPTSPYRKSHLINQLNGAGVNYQVNFTVHYGLGSDSNYDVYLNSLSRTDFQDIRIYSINGSLLNAWNETQTNGNTIKVWIKIMANLSTSSETIYLYYGNSSNTAYWNASSLVFQRVISNSVVLALPLNEGSGTNLMDYSGNNNNGTITNAAWVTTGKFGNALSFDGAGDYATLSQKISITSAFTVLVGFKRNGASGGSSDSSYHCYLRNINGFGDNYVYAETDGSYSRVYINPASRIVSIPNVNNWHLIGAEWNGTLLYALRDTTLSAGIALASISSGASVGVIGYFSANYYNTNATLENLIVLNRSITSDELTDFNNYYPQVSSSNLGSLYLRSHVNPEPTQGVWGAAEQYIAPAPTLAPTASPSPTPDPNALTIDDAVGLAVVGVVFAVSLPLAFVVYKRKQSD